MISITEKPLPGSARNRNERRSEKRRMDKLNAAYGTMYERIDYVIAGIVAYTARHDLTARPDDFEIRAHPKALRYFAVCFGGDPTRVDEMRFQGPDDAWSHKWRGIPIFEASSEPRDRIRLLWAGAPEIAFPIEGRPYLVEAEPADGHEAERRRIVALVLEGGK